MDVCTKVAHELAKQTNLPVADWNVIGGELDTVELFDSNDTCIGQTTATLLDQCVSTIESQQ